MDENRIIDTSDLSRYEAELEAFLKSPPRKRGLKCPYVVYGGWTIEHSSTPGVEPTLAYSTRPFLFMTNPPSISKLQYYKNKGWRVLAYWFPTRADLPKKQPETEASWPALLRSAKDDPYSEARNWCDSMINAAMQKNATMQEISKLKQELKKAEDEKSAKSRRSKTRSEDKSSDANSVGELPQETESE